MKTLTSQEISEVIRINKPLEKAYITQKFGQSSGITQKWYESFGWKGHNGIDYGASIGTEIYSVYPGRVAEAYTSAGGGKILSIDTNFTVYNGIEFKLRFYYLHLSEFKVKVGDYIDMGKLVALSGNTGKYTTGPHLHFGVCPIYKIDSTMEKKDYSNGYDGAINPAPLFNDINWDKLPVDRYYDKKRNWELEYTFRFANTPIGTFLSLFLAERIEAARYVHKKLSLLGRKPPILTNRELNAIIYGSWDLETVLDPAMFAIWGWYTKAKYLQLKREGKQINTPLRR